MNYINELMVLDFYIERIEKDEIAFLKGRENYKLGIIEGLQNLKQQSEIHKKIKISVDLWKLLFEAAMSQIDDDKSGYDELFKYFDQYVGFEELIFASDSFYRDHTMHSLWVYFLSEYMHKSDEFDMFFTNVDKQLKNYTHLDSQLNNEEYNSLFPGLKDLNNELLKLVKYQDAIRCIVSLTHDLGYPVKKITTISKHIKDIMPYFGIKKFDDFSFSYDDMQDILIKDFLDFLQLDFKSDIENNNSIMKKVRPLLVIDGMELAGINEAAIDSLSEEDKEEIRKYFRMRNIIIHNFDSRVRYTSDFDSYQHGIMSAYLLFRNVKAFRNLQIRYIDYNNLRHPTSNYANIGCKQYILQAISDHTSNGFQISSIKEHSEFLTFIDELEEFSRISRANQNRQFINEFCKTRIYTENEYLNVDFIFDNEKIDNLDPERAFKGRCKRFLSLFRIPELDNNFKLKLNCIGQLSYDKNTYTLEIRRNYANITINNVEQNIPMYLKTRQFNTKEGYMNREE